MSNARVRVNGNELQVNGRFQYVRQVGDVGDISTSNASYTNSFSVIRDNNSTRALKGLGLPGSMSDVPYTRISWMMYVDELPIIDRNGWAIVNETDQSNYKLSIIDGNIDFWKAIEDLKLSDLDLSEARYAKTRQGIIDSFESPYQKYLLGYYAYGEEEKTGYDINLLNPAISDKYIVDQIFSHIGMTYSLTPEIDTWTIIGRTDQSETVNVLNLVVELADGFKRHPYVDGRYQVAYSNIEETEATYDTNTGRITVEQTGNYRPFVDWTQMYAGYVLRSQDGLPFVQDLPINNYLEVNGFRDPLDEVMYLLPSDEIYLRFEPLTEDQLGEHGFADHQILGIRELTTFDYVFELERIDEIFYSFSNELSKISVKDFMKEIMHRYGLTLFYKNRHAEFLTISERINADVEDLNDYFVEVKNEKYFHTQYAQINYLKHKYADPSDFFNDGVISIRNQNLDPEKTIIESFTYSQDINGIMEMWEYKGEGVPYEQIKGRMFSARADVRWDSISFRDRDEPLPGYAGNVSFVDFSKTGFRYYVNRYYKEFEEKILNNFKMQTIKMDMPLSVFLNLDMRKVIYVQQSNFIINKMTYRGLRDVELEVVKIN